MPDADLTEHGFPSAFIVSFVSLAHRLLAQLTGMQLAGVPGANGALNCSFVMLRAP